MKVLFLITARGGSKTVPGKNLRKLADITLVGFKAISARKSKYCSRLIISTDSPDIQANAREYGVEVPFTRPAELATDTAQSADVILHAMDWIEREAKERYDAIMLLEPSSPFARPMDYDNAVELMMLRNANVVLGMRRMEVNSMFTGPMDAQGRISDIIDKVRHWDSTRRQDLPQEYTMNAALYLFKWEYFKTHKSLYRDRDATYGYVMEPEYSVEIDDMNDLRRAEFVVKKRLIDLSCWSS